VTRVVLVTGASAGIGAACATTLDGAGWTVVGASRRGTTPAGTGLTMDVDDDQSVATGVASVLETHGRIDALLAAAGWGVAGSVEDTTLDEARAQLETNFFGAVRCVKAVLPLMRIQGRGRIVLVSSLGGVIGLPFQAFYSASKFALEGFGEALAYEVRPFGIDVTLVEPGNVATEFTGARRWATATEGDPYRAACDKARATIERDERDGAPAGSVAATVRRVLETRRAPRRRTVGKAGERLGAVAKRVLPARVFEAAAGGSLGV